MALTTAGRDLIATAVVGPHGLHFAGHFGGFRAVRVRHQSRG